MRFALRPDDASLPAMWRWLVRRWATSCGPGPAFCQGPCPCGMAFWHASAKAVPGHKHSAAPAVFDWAGLAVTAEAIRRAVGWSSASWSIVAARLPALVVCALAVAFARVLALGERPSFDLRAWPAGMALARLLGDALFRGLAGTAFPDLAAVTRTESGQEHGVWASAYAGAYLPGWLGLPMLGGLGFREERELLLSPCRAGQPFASAQLARPWSIVAGLYLLAAAALDRCALRSGPSA